MIPIEILIEAFKATLDLTGNLGKFDDNAYAENIRKLYGKEPTYDEFDAQVEVVKNDPDLSTQEKLELLRAISVQKDSARKREVELMGKCAEYIDNGMAKKGEVATKILVTVVKAFFTAGLSLLPIFNGHDNDSTNIVDLEDENDDDDNDDVA